MRTSPRKESRSGTSRRKGPLDQRRRRSEGPVVDFLAPPAADLEHVAETRRRQKSDSGALLLYQCVHADSGAVEQLADILESDTESVDAGDKLGRQLVGDRAFLLDPDLTGLRIEQDEIDEGAADIDGDAIARSCLHDASFQPASCSIGT